MCVFSRPVFVSVGCTVAPEFSSFAGLTRSTLDSRQQVATSSTVHFWAAQPTPNRPQVALELLCTHSRTIHSWRGSLSPLFWFKFKMLFDIFQFLLVLEWVELERKVILCPNLKLFWLILTTFGILWLILTNSSRSLRMKYWIFSKIDENGLRILIEFYLKSSKYPKN